MEVEAHITSNIGLDGQMFSVINSKIGDDGGFRFTGAPPGMMRFSLICAQGNAFYIKRVERDGVEIKNAIEIRRGEQINSVRIVVAHAKGTIRGQVKVTGGKAPEDWGFLVWAIPIRIAADNEPQPAHDSGSSGATADGKGRFVIEGLAPGEYELTLKTTVGEGPFKWRSAPGTIPVSQRVTVSNGAVTAVKFTLDLSRK